MKIKGLLIGAFLMGSMISFGQTEGENRECDRMLFLAQDARINKKDFRESSVYMLKAEEICGGFDQKNMEILLASLKNTIATVEDAAVQKAYIDTLVAAFERAEKVGAYDKEDDLLRAYYIAQSSSPDPVKSDSLFRAGIAAKGTSTKEHYISFYYYNLYVLYAGATGEKQKEYKKRMIDEYFTLTDLIIDAKMSENALVNLNNYLNATIQSCEDLYPELKEFMADMPEDKNAAVTKIKNFLTLLENKNCTESQQYENLVLKLDQLDPSLDSKLVVAKLFMSKGKYSDAMKAFREVMSMTTDQELKEEAKYNIAYCQFKSGAYSSAYSTAMDVEGKLKGQALELAAQSVARNKDNCGASTFDRKCNYYYAVELLERAQALGHSVGGLISTYKSNFPTEEEKFTNGVKTGDTVTIPCYGVTVEVK